jgi:cytochrome c oxidase accessory protein FixG
MVSFAGPAEVNGFYQRIRNLLQPLLIILFLATPWIQIHGEPMLLIDVVHRHFVFFGAPFYSHEAPLLFFLVILIVLSIFLVTALYGRLWCGWMCPQTVFLSGLFNRLEKWILGSYTKRTLFYREDDSFQKKIKIISIYGIFLLICWILSHSFMAYFVGASVITQFILDGPAAHMSLFVVCIVITLGLFFNFAFFREKLCVYICPYGRFQNALIDENSLIVFYDQLRGEPRGKFSNVESEKGDCVDCHRCVNVCPAKIDIRNGFQLECISCAQCIDACDAVMKKMNRPERLIRYETGNQKPIALSRFRLALYGLLIVLFSTGFAYSLHERSDIDFNLSRSHINPFGVRWDNGRKILQNQLHIHIKNHKQRPLKIDLDLSQKNQADGFHISSPAMHVQLDAGQDLKTTAFVEIPAEQFMFDNNDLEIILHMPENKIQRQLKFIRQD